MVDCRLYQTQRRLATQCPTLRGVYEPKTDRNGQRGRHGSPSGDCFRLSQTDARPRQGLVAKMSNNQGSDGTAKRQGYYKEWHYKFGAIEHVTPDGYSKTDYTLAGPGSALENVGGTFVPLEVFEYIDVINRQQGLTRHW